MKAAILFVGSVAFVLGSTGAHADETAYGRLAYAAHDLAYASQELVKTVRVCEPGSRIAADVETLYDSTEHFQEEVDLGPQDLDVDFDTIEAVFNQVRTEVLADLSLQQNQPAKTAWFEVEEANIQLRTAWTTSGFNNPGTNGYMQCSATNNVGQTFSGVGATQSDAQGVAMEYCNAGSQPNTCVIGPCRPYQG